METRILSRYNRPDARLLDLPIRDGNAKAEDPDAIDALAFRPSYQGWKPYVKVDADATACGF